MLVNRLTKRRQAGFTLIELVSSLVITALALAALANFFFSQTQRSIEPLFQIRAAKLAEALLEEILSQRFDEMTAIGGVPACGELGAPLCTLASSFGGVLSGELDEVSRDLFDDIDDYHVYCNDSSPLPIADGFGNSTGDGNALIDFDRFKMSICIGYDDDYNGIVNDGGGMNAKLITIKLFPPSVAGAGEGPPLVFKVYRGNF